MGGEMCLEHRCAARDFNRRYARPLSGATTRRLTSDVYDLLSNKVLPYGEPVLAHQPTTSTVTTIRAPDR
jgi:hypothetical protein